MPATSSPLAARSKARSTTKFPRPSAPAPFAVPHLADVPQIPDQVHQRLAIGVELTPALEQEADGLIAAAKAVLKQRYDEAHHRKFRHEKSRYTIAAVRDEEED